MTEHTPSRVHTCRVPNSERSKGPYTAMYVAAVFATAETWNKPQCPSTNGGHKKMWHRWSMDISVGHKERREALPLVKSHDGPRDS